MKNLIYTLAITIGIASYSNAQLGYNTAIGLRAGGTSGLTLKQTFGDNAVEGIIGVWNYGFTVTGLYEHYTHTKTNGLHWYYGLGGHIAANTGYRYWYDSRRDRYYRDGGGLGLGIDGIVGLEFKIPNAPIAFSLDLKPYVEFNNNGYVYTALDPGLGIKVAF